LDAAPKRHGGHSRDKVLSSEARAIPRLEQNSSNRRTYEQQYFAQHHKGRGATDDGEGALYGAETSKHVVGVGHLVTLGIAQANAYDTRPIQ